jgi:hypothetical protein
MFSASALRLDCMSGSPCLSNGCQFRQGGDGTAPAQDGRGVKRFESISAISLANGRMRKVGSETTQTGIRCWMVRAAWPGLPVSLQARQAGGCELPRRHEHHRSTSTRSLDCASTLAVPLPRLIAVTATHCPGDQRAIRLRQQQADDRTEWKRRRRFALSRLR